MPKTQTQLPQLTTRAAVQPKTFDAERRTVELTWTTGAQVRRFDWMEGPYLEELSMDPRHVRMQRLESGAPVLANHSTHSLHDVIGVVLRAWLDGAAGKAEIRFSDRAELEPILADIQAGILRHVSVGYQVHEYEVDRPSRKGDLPTYRAIDWEPMEVSIVTVPADPAAQIRSASALHPVLLTMRNAAMSDPNDQNPAANESPDSASTTPDTPKDHDITEIAQRAIAQERTRIAGIRDTVRLAKLPDSVADAMIDSGRPLDECRAEVLRQWSSQVDASAAPGHLSMGETDREKSRHAAEQALLARAGLVDYTELNGNDFRGLRLSDFVRQALEQEGHKTRGLSYDAMAAMALRTQTTSDFPVLLQNTMHKILLSAYGTAPDVWRQISRVGSVSDFRAWKRLRTGTLGNLSAVNEAGELTNMPISDATAESVQASRYGNIISITPETIVNDDFDWIANQSAALGRAAARTVEAAVFAKLLANPTMSDGEALLSAAHGNIQTSGAAISVATVDAGRVAMASQMDNDGHDYLNIRPSILLCPVAVGGVARVVAGSQYDPDSAARLLVPNKVAGLIGTVLDTPRITTGWYLFASPSEAAVIEVVFLDGNQSPRIQQEENFRTKGLSWSVELPFGVGIIDYRGVYWNDGA